MSTRRADPAIRSTALMIAAAAMPLPIAVLVIACSTPVTPAPRHPSTARIAVGAEAPPSPGAAFSKAEIRCLARAIWYEARGESLEGQIAVAEVVLTRSADRRWRGDLCSTVRARRQFSFVVDGRIPTVPGQADAQRMMDLARDVAAGRSKSRVRGAMFYHATWCKPVWRHALKRIATIGNHVFYVEKPIEEPRKA